jgi:hypothetical protein
LIDTLQTTTRLSTMEHLLEKYLSWRAARRTWRTQMNQLVL